MVPNKILHSFGFATVSIAMLGVSFTPAHAEQLGQVAHTADARRPSTSLAVYILGAVRHPGLFWVANNDSKPGENSGPRLSAALQAAGGVLETADWRRVRLTRLRPQITRTVNLWRLLLSCDRTQDFELASGDVLFVPPAGNHVDVTNFGKAATYVSRVRVTGAVKKPGLFQLTGEDDILSMLAKAGGFANSGQAKIILISRRNRDGTISTLKINLKEVLRPPEGGGKFKVKTGDVIVVSDSAQSKTLANMRSHRDRNIGDFWSGLSQPHEP